MAKPPLLSFAVFCEKALIEQDGTLTLVRIIDRAMKPPQIDEERRKPLMNLTLAIGLRSGDFSGKGQLSVTARFPSGKEMPQPKPTEVVLSGGDAGQNVVTGVILGIEEDGTYWFDVRFDSHLLTQIPLTVVSSPPATDTSSQPIAPPKSR